MIRLHDTTTEARRKRWPSVVPGRTAATGREMRERKPVSMTADTTQPVTGQSAPTTHEGILSWVTEVAELTQPGTQRRDLAVLGVEEVHHLV